jgi:hypothetical protein
MYLVDTNVISEARKRVTANRGVRAFFRWFLKERMPVFILEIDRDIAQLQDRLRVGGSAREKTYEIPGLCQEEEER